MIKMWQDTALIQFRRYMWKRLQGKSILYMKCYNLLIYRHWFQGGNCSRQFCAFPPSLEVRAGGTSPSMGEVERSRTPEPRSETTRDLLYLINTCLVSTCSYPDSINDSSLYVKTILEEDKIPHSLRSFGMTPDRIASSWGVERRRIFYP